jgi:hypothetical protein
VVPTHDAPPVFLVQLIDVLPYYLNELLFGTVLEILFLEWDLHWQTLFIVGRHPVANVEDVAAY